MPEDSDIPVTQLRFVCASSAQQVLPVLRPGTAAKGAVGFGDQTGTRRLKVGDKLDLVATWPGALIVRPHGTPADTEVLILPHHATPI